MAEPVPHFSPLKRRSDILRSEDSIGASDLELDVVHNADCLAALKKLPSNSVHLILSDIPYGIGVDDWDVLHSNTNSAYLGNSPAQEKAGAIFKKRGKPINGWSDADRAIPREYYEWCSSWAGEWLRVLKPGGAAIVFAGRRLMHRGIAALEDAGFNYRDMLAWVRDRAPHRAQRLSIVFERRGDVQSAALWDGWRVGNLRPSFEPIIWCFKPYRVTIADNVLEHGVGAYNEEAFVRHFERPDNIIRSGFAPGEGGLHPTQKPLQLMSALIELTTQPGQIVLDPFAGSGTTLLAAKQLGRRFVGVEIDPRYARVANDRLQTLL
ncbi:site-specific DNA-methyltransferase [Rhodopseudomonas palustris]|uniref:Methyltransferase n=1 Tax=Rhodopseudomonas palustris TaxID=1076 RepID=A0A323UN80_RHOPL|nr:site-specific DNA-methyltransferase [Rhodopseudomonas palustris]PZA12536.1 site-specific DNA-methyltransferase [Rhodopseudomonas palustris]